LSYCLILTQFSVLTGQDPKEIFRGSFQLLSKEVKNSISLALFFHDKQIRKGDGHPYLEHPLDVAHFLWRNKFSPEIIASGYCHDLLEDTKCPEHTIKEHCNDEVLRIVKAVSNDESLSDKKDWELKKSKYIKSVEKGGEKAIAVCIADKICNLYSFFKQYKIDGPQLWNKFNRGKDKKVWFENEVLKMAKNNWKHPILNTFEDLIQKLEQLPS
jgi:(p)ppGpp synthase/HD superfamily hydrolase